MQVCLIRCRNDAVGLPPNTELDGRSALPGLAEPLRVAVVAAVFDAVSRAHLSVRAMTAEELQRVLADWSLRLLR